MRTSFLSTLLLGLACTAQANVTLPAIFTDHMVLQRDKPIPVWGWAEAGEEVKVSFADDTQTTKAGADGKWKVALHKLTASAEPRVLTVTGRNALMVKDVLVGEVWLCSGQSNMGMSVNGVKDAAKEIAGADFPNIRMFFVQSFTALTPQEQCRGVWQLSTPRTIPNFSAAAYFFGRDLHADLKVPVGLINSSVGGTAIESWTSMEVMKDKAELKPLLEQWKKDIALSETPENKAKNDATKAKWQAEVKASVGAKTPPRLGPLVGKEALDANAPANLFNGKIAPLIPFAIRGAVWYQGESNAANGPLYAVQLPLMVRDWRARWAEDFPFGWVQLPNFLARDKAPDAPSHWARLREAETQSLSLPNTGMTVNLDIGEAGNIHPLNKQEIGHRLALWARAKVYGESIAWSGPVYSGYEIKGGEAIIRFDHAEGLKTIDGGTEVKGFAIADEQHHWQWAKARIEGDHLIVSHSDIKTPSAVRYAWANNPEVNLVNSAGLPAAPFRTDDWSMDNFSKPVGGK